MSQDHACQRSGRTLEEEFKEVHLYKQQEKEHWRKRQQLVQRCSGATRCGVFGDLGWGGMKQAWRGKQKPGLAGYMCVLSQTVVCELHTTFCDPMDCSQARIPEWVAMPSSRGSSQLRGRTQVSCIAGGFFTI